MDRSQKEIAVKEIEEIFDSAGSVVMAAYSGMTVAEMTELRAKLREKGATIRVVKNRLAKIALKGKPFEAAAEKFTGPVAIAWAQDMIVRQKWLLNTLKIPICSKFLADLWVKKSSTSLALSLYLNCHLAKSLSQCLLSFCWHRQRV